MTSFGTYSAFGTEDTVYGPAFDLGTGSHTLSPLTLTLTQIDFDGGDAILVVLVENSFDGVTWTTVDNPVFSAEVPAVRSLGPYLVARYLRIAWLWQGTPPFTGTATFTATSTVSLAGGDETDPFITVAELGDFLNQDLTDSDAATFAIAAACDTVRTLTEQVLTAVVDDTVTLDGTGTDALLLPERPVVSVSDVSEDDEDLVVDDDYKLNGNGILLRMPLLVEAGWSTYYSRTYWSAGRQNISVTYSHGYDTVPGDLKMVAIAFAARFFSQGIVSFESLGAYSVRYNGNSTDSTLGERAILRKYKQAK